MHDNWQSVENNRQAVGGVEFRLGGVTEGDEKRREVRRKRNGRAYRASSPAASKRFSNGKLSPTGVPPHPTVLLDVPWPRVPQLTSQKHYRWHDVCHRVLTLDRRIFQPILSNLLWPCCVSTFIDNICFVKYRNVDRSLLHQWSFNFQTRGLISVWAASVVLLLDLTEHERGAAISVYLVMICPFIYKYSSGLLFTNSIKL